MLSVVVPVYNEEESLGAFYKELIFQVSKLKVRFEVIFVDDGSTDGSLALLKKIEKENKNIRLFSFRRNQGKAEALTLGFSKAKGDLIVTLDADLQDKPSEIKKLIEKQKEGWDLVSGWRRNRKDSLAKIVSSNFFNFLLSFISGLKLHDYNCGLKLYTIESCKALRLYGNMHRFIPLLVSEQGFSVTEVPVIHEKRKFGKSKYKFSKVFKDLPDIFTVLFLSRYSRRPLHFFALIGGILFSAGIIILGYLTILRLEGYSIGRRPLLFLGMLLVISGLQVLLTGFIADLLLHFSENSNNVENKHFLKYSSDK